MKEVLEGLQILAKYYGDEGYVAAEHDVIYAGGDVGVDDFSAEDLARLAELGWHFDESLPAWTRGV